jgi:hypothetical protein
MQQHMRPAFPNRAAITLLLAQPSLEKPAKSLNWQILQQEHITALTPRIVKIKAEASGEVQGEDMSRASNVSRDSTYSMGSLQTGLSGDTGSLPSLMAQNDWEIAPMDIEIMRREDGSPWELGAGAFGKVRACTALCASQNSCMLHVWRLGQNASASWHGRLVGAFLQCRAQE